MTHKNTAFLLGRRTAELGMVLSVTAMLTACGAGGMDGPNTSNPSASVGNQGTGGVSPIQSVPANPGSVPNGTGAFPANAGSGPR